MRDRPPAMQLLSHPAVDEFVAARVSQTLAAEKIERPNSIGRTIAVTKYILLPSCGLLALYSDHTSLPELSGRSRTPQHKHSDWKESRDGTAQLRKLAESHFHKVRMSSPERHDSPKEQPEWSDDDSPQPMIS